MIPGRVVSVSHPVWIEIRGKREGREVGHQRVPDELVLVIRACVEFDELDTPIVVRIHLGDVPEVERGTRSERHQKHCEEESQEKCLHERIVFLTEGSRSPWPTRHG